MSSTISESNNSEQEVVTIVRYRVVIEEAVVSLEGFHKYNDAGKEQDFYEDPEVFFKCKFEDWEMDSPCAMFDVNELVQGQRGHGYIAFLGDVRSHTDDVVSLTDPKDWQHSDREPISIASNDYMGYWRERVESGEI